MIRLGGPLFAALTLVASLAGLSRSAEALPVFAHRYNLTCQTCHSTVPRLNEFGASFLANGFRIGGLRPDQRAFPVAVKSQLGYDSRGNGDGLPKSVVDEVELLTGGSIGSRGAYWWEQYVVDGGRPGHTRDAWFAWRATPQGARTPVWIRAGQQTLELPVDPETERESPEHYAIFDQTAGDNPFSFFDPKLAVSINAGSDDGLFASFAAVQGHESQSGLPARGVDRYAIVKHQREGWTLSAYRYDGTRTLPSGVSDRFWRQGYGLGHESGRLALDAVYQRGRDGAANAFGDPLDTSGGFVQARMQWTPRFFTLARYEGTYDVAFRRYLTAGAGYRLARNMRLTAFDTIERGDDGARHHSLQTSLLFAY